MAVSSLLAVLLPGAPAGKPAAARKGRPALLHREARLGYGQLNHSWRVLLRHFADRTGVANQHEHQVAVAEVFLSRGVGLFERDRVNAGEKPVDFLSAEAE